MNPHDATEIAYKNGYEKGKADALAKDNNVPSKWIPVTERLPEEDGDYLVYCGEYYGIFVVYYEVLKTKSKWCCKWKEVTHWMPLPEPPKGE